MPYRSGAVATVSPAPVSYKMPVPASHSRFTSLVSGSSHRTSSSLNSSLDRSYYTSLTRTIPRSYTLDYKSKYTSPSRWVPEFSYVFNVCIPFSSAGLRIQNCHTTLCIQRLSENACYFSVQTSLFFHKLWKIMYINKNFVTLYDYKPMVWTEMNQTFKMNDVWTMNL